MNFPNYWIQKLMQCIITVSYKVIVNGEHTPEFSPNKGVKQGDPLSLYIFILCLNVLSCTLNTRKLHKQMQGIKVSKYVISVYHLLYVDALLLFFRATLDAC